MALDDDTRVLSGVRLFESLTQEQVRLLAFGAENIRLAKDRVLYREDTPADCAYVVVHGSIGLYRTIDGVRERIGRAMPGTMLDEMALIVQSTRQTGAVAEEGSEVIRLNRILFRRLLEEYPEVAYMLRNRIAAEFSAMADKIIGLQPRFDD